MIPLFYDLHIHSCLSPCGDDDMTPANIAGMAAVKGLDVIALTDHNSCRNCPAAMYHGERYGVTVIPGMELTTQEEVHVICLFPTLENALAFDALVYEKLMPFPNREDIFGKQQIMDQEDRVIGTVENLLINATSISFDDVFPWQQLMAGSHILPTWTKPPTAFCRILVSSLPAAAFPAQSFMILRICIGYKKSTPILRGAVPSAAQTRIICGTSPSLITKSVPNPKRQPTSWLH